MPLLPGSHLGPYEIGTLLGAGGMGEVYRARDPRLDRAVAIKILPAELSADADHLHRFEREARSASALNHPNIVTIYELAHDGSTRYIAMELIEGQTLRQLLASGTLPIRKAIEIAAQVAEGLAKAHEASIAHRDLKPENLMISSDGFVKILDFGLAKVATRAPEQQETRELSGWQTQAGVVVGTVQYMSPEQASGAPFDFRSDQYSFGLVLYKRVTGKRAFPRKTVAETLVAIIRKQAEPIAVQNPDAPAPLCWAIERCLAKDPDKRYVSTRDLARELAAIRDRFSEKPARQAEPRPVNIPVQRTAFVGREKEIAAAKELLLSKDARLVTVTGPGGIGKTRLGVEIASSVLENFPGGIHFVPLSPLRDPALVAAVIVQTLGIREAGGQSPLDLLKRHFQEASRAPMLFLLDNFEHLMPAAALHVYGEQEFPVPALGVPESHAKPSLSALSQFPAVALFVQRAIAARPDFELNQQNASAVIEICARLDGLPLAIELAAARIKVLSPSAMCTRLASRLQLLTGGARDLPQRQQTLRAAFDWSHDLLIPAEQKLFRRLSVFVGGCTLEGIEAVCDTKGDLELDLLDGMASMVDKSLLQQLEQANGESRFAMLETIREYAREKLETSGEDAATKRAHAAYCLVLAEEVATAQPGTEGAESRERVALEHDNFRAALDWLTESGDAVWGLRLGTALFRYWESHEYLAEGRDSLGKVLRIPAAAAPTKARARAVFAAGVLANEQGDYAAADALMMESLVIGRELGDTQGVAVSVNARAVLARDQGNVALAHSLFQESLTLWRELGDLKAIARALSNLASVLKMQGEYDLARSLCSECRAIFEGLGDRTGAAWSLNNEGDIARDQGDSAAARALFEQALAIFRELDDPWGIAGTLADLGTLAREEQNCSAALVLFRESLKIFRQLEHKRGMARLLECCACSAAVEKQAARSLRLAGTAAALRQNIGAPLTVAEQVKLETILEPSRQALSNTATAWLEGWDMPLDRAIEEVLAPEATSQAG